MTKRNHEPFQSWVPNNIRELIIAWGWVRDDQWVVCDSTHCQVAHRLCTTDSDEARRAWRVFDLTWWQLVANDAPVTPLTEADRANAVRHAFYRFLNNAAVALDGYDKEKIITKRRLDSIARQAAELREALQGIETLLPGYVARWRLLGHNKGWAPIKRRGKEIVLAIEVLEEWAREKSREHYLLQSQALQRTANPFATRAPNARVKQRAKWLAAKFLDGNPPQAAEPIAALINVALDDPNERVTAKDVEQLRL